MTLVSALAVGVLYGTGIYLLLQRTLTRIIVGLALMGHGANLLLITAAGPRAAPPIIGEQSLVPGEVADPLPQALALTAIVITFGVIAFLLTLAYRSWQLSGDDEVEDDVEDRRVAAESPARRPRAARLGDASQPDLLEGGG